MTRSTKETADLILAWLDARVAVPEHGRRRGPVRLYQTLMVYSHEGRWLDILDAFVRHMRMGPGVATVKRKGPPAVLLWAEECLRYEGVIP